MSGITLTGVTDATIPTPPSGKDTLYMSTTQGEPAYKDDAGVVHTLKGATGATGPAGAAGMDAFPLDVVVHGNCGATETFDFGDGSYVAATSGAVHSGTLNADLTVTLATSVASGKEVLLTVDLTEDGTGGWTVTLPASVTNKAAIEAAIDTSIGARNRLYFVSTDGGTSWLGLLPGATGPTGATGAAGAGVPTGGTAGQVLSKIDGTDYNTQWVSPSGGVTYAALTPSSDTYIDSGTPTGQYDTSTAITVGNKWGTSSFTRFGLLTVDTSSLSGKTVLSAILRLVRTDTNALTAAATKLQARRILRAYNATQVTWNVYSTGNNWTTAGAESTGNDVGTEVYDGPVLSSGGLANQVVRLDLTELVKDDLTAGSTTLRVILGGANADGSINAVSFASLNHATSAYRPVLEVTYL